MVRMGKAGRRQSARVSLGAPLSAVQVVWTSWAMGRGGVASVEDAAICSKRKLTSMCDEMPPSFSDGCSDARFEASSR